jgi:nitrous oxidase accessory protein NosD
MSVRGMGRRALLAGAPVAAGTAVLGLGPERAGAAAATSTASPRDYGAVGDGVADDTAAVNACLAANRAVDFGGPESTYLITGTLLVEQTAGQVLFGHGATVRAGAAVNMMRMRNAGHAIGGIVFDGNGQADGVGLIVEGTAPRCRIEDCAFLNVAGCAVAVSTGAHFASVVACTMRHCGHGSAVVAPRNTTVWFDGADHCRLLDSDLLECDWGVYFRGDAQSPGIGYYNCRGNTITCVSPAPAAAQGISNRWGRGGRIENNTIEGFSDNSIDCWGCNCMTISGNATTSGKDGVFVGDESTYAVTITGNLFRSPQRGVRVLSGTAGASVTGVVISGNTVTYPTDAGVLVAESGTAAVSGVTITGNVFQIADAGSYGIHVVNAEQTLISANRIYRPRLEGILLDGVDITQVTDNLVNDAGHSAANTYDAVSITGSNRVQVRTNMVYGSARYAVNIDGGTGMTVAGNRYRSVGTGGVVNAATNSVVSDNLQI